MLQTFRSMCDNSWVKNGELLSKSIIPDNQLPFLNSAFIRFHAHGELINKIHAINLFNIAKKNPHARIGFWTKRKDIIGTIARSKYKIPGNVNLIYSNPKVDSVMTKVPKHFKSVFNVVEDDTETKINCGGKKCMECMLCYKSRPCKIITEKLKT